MPQLLAPSFEYSLFAALLSKQIEPSEVDKASLSHFGKIIHKSILELAKSGESWDHHSVALMAVETLGADKSKVYEFLDQANKHEVPAVNTIYGMIRERQALLEAAQEIQKQLATGTMDLGKLQGLVNTTVSKGQGDLRSVTDDLIDGEPLPPSGPGIRSLPRLSKATNGVFGIYIIAALPNIGKTVLANQLGVDVSKDLPVIYYDFENTRRVLLYRLVKNFGLDSARKIGTNWYIRESIRSLYRDLQQIKPPAVIVIDSIQKISTKGDDRREGLDAWIHNFEEIKLQGYHIILISEVNRASYTGVPKLDAFKESGALEYAADSAVVLTEESSGSIKTWHVKNRHYPHKGPSTLMERSRDYWFRELDIDLVEESIG